jgi:hypothetical protein
VLCCVVLCCVAVLWWLRQSCECPEQRRPPPAAPEVSAGGGDKSLDSDADAVNNSSGDDADRAGDVADSDAKSDSSAEVECYTCPTCSNKVC